MLRSLLLKKVLAYANVALIVALAAYAVFRLADLPSKRIIRPAKVDVLRTVSTIDLPNPPQFGKYNSIISSDMFGENARGRPKPPPKPQKPKPPPPKKEVITSLPLRLIGTVVAFENDPSASAIIERRGGGSSKKTYFLGDEVMDGIVLKTIKRRMVVLDNQRANRLEQLYLEDGKEKFRNVSRSSARSRAEVLAERADLAARIRASRPAVEGANRIFTFNRQEIISQLEAQYDRLASSVDVRIVKDANGNVQGVQASNISQTPLAQKFGLQDGDVVQSVNGQQIDSMDRLYEIVEQNQNSSKFNVQLMRGGRKQVFTYHLR